MEYTDGLHILLENGYLDWIIKDYKLRKGRDSNGDYIVKTPIVIPKYNILIKN